MESKIGEANTHIIIVVWSEHIRVGISFIGKNGVTYSIVWKLNLTIIQIISKSANMAMNKFVREAAPDYFTLQSPSRTVR
jgi:hypothetical protein